MKHESFRLMFSYFRSKLGTVCNLLASSGLTFNEVVYILSRRSKCIPVNILYVFLDLGDSFENIGIQSYDIP